MSVGPVQIQPLEDASTLLAALQPNVFVQIWRAVNAFILGPAWQANCWIEFNQEFNRPFLLKEFMLLHEKLYLEGNEAYLTMAKIICNINGTALYKPETAHKNANLLVLRELKKLKNIF
jgi:hypothetical protein